MGRRYLLGVLLGLAAVLARWALIPVWGTNYPFFTFFPAVLVSAWLGGFGSGLMTIAVAVLGGWYVLSPIGPTVSQASGEALAWGLFIVVNVVLAALTASMHHARQRAAAAQAVARHSERQLRQDEARFRALIESVASIVWHADVAGSLIEAPGWEEVTGQRREEYRGVGWLNALHADDRDAAAEVWRSGIAGERPVTVEFRLRHRNGSYRWMGVRAVPTLAEGGYVTEWVATVTDNHERLTADEARGRLVAIVDSSDDAIVGKSLDGIVTSWNAGAERIFGYTADEMIGQPVARLVPPDRPDEGPSILAAIRQGGRVEHFQTERLRKDGERIHVSLTISPIKDADGRIIGASKIARDVTKERRAAAERETLLAAAEAAAIAERESRETAEAASRAKDAFLATISHELRTPLSPILTWARILQQPGLDPAQLARGLEVITRSARSQAQLVEDLLDVSRIVAGKMRLEVRPVELGPVITSAVDVVRPAADGKSVHLRAILDTEVGPILGDAERLQQVVWNLLSNAVRFTPKGGAVQVVLERVNSHVEVAVGDTGQGIDPAFLNYVFDRFRQADARASRAHGGLGLGLAIVRHIVEAHGGTVHAESAGVGKGAVFTVKLPLMIPRVAGETERRHPTAGRVSEAQNLPRLDGLRVLLVDDEADSNEAVRGLLEILGATVRTAPSAAAGRQVLAGWTPDIMVSDVGMPGEDGYAFIASLRERDDRIGQLPAIALTAYASREDKVRLLSAGFQAHVPKPVDASELATVLASLARSAGKM